MTRTLPFTRTLQVFGSYEEIHSGTVFHGLADRLTEWLVEENSDNPGKYDLSESARRHASSEPIPERALSTAAAIFEVILPTLEPMACGTLFITRDSEGPREFAEHGARTSMARPCDVGTLTRYAERTLEDNDLRRRMG